MKRQKVKKRTVTRTLVIDRVTVLKSSAHGRLEQKRLNAGSWFGLLMYETLNPLININPHNHRDSVKALENNVYNVVSIRPTFADTLNLHIPNVL